MASTLLRSRPVRVLVGLALFVALGYISNVVSVSSCEAKTKTWLSGILDGTKSDWPGRSARAEPPEFVLPWFVTVDYQWIVAPKGGEGGTRYYLCVFGLALDFGKKVREQA